MAAPAATVATLTEKLTRPPPSRTWSAAVSSISDRKSTRLNSSHANISYAVFCLKKKDHQLACSRIAAHHVACVVGPGAASQHDECSALPRCRYRRLQRAYCRDAQPAQYYAPRPA